MARTRGLEQPPPSCGTGADALSSPAALAALAVPSRRHLRPRSRALTLALAPMLLSACLAQQRPAEKLIDPRLRDDATLLVATRGPELAFDRYRVVDVELRDEPFDGSGPLSTSARGRATQQQRMNLRMIGGELEWQVECIAQRRSPPDADFAAAADEAHDEVAITCQIRGGEQRWRLQLGGVLGSDLLGELHSVDEREVPVAFELELLVWYQLWKFVRRSLPTPLVQIRDDSGTKAAMIFARPERVWFDRRLEARDGEVLLASLMALRLVPIGLET
jgi:hypothetical protein